MDYTNYGDEMDNRSDFSKEKFFGLVDFAYAIIDASNRIAELESENARLREDVLRAEEYMESTRQHSSNMIGGTLKLLLVPGVAEAIAASTKDDGEDLPLYGEDSPLRGVDVESC